LSFGNRKPKPRSGKKSGLGKGPKKKQKPFLHRNKKFTGILLLIILGLMAGVHGFMWSLWDKTCIVSCDDPNVGCFHAVGYLAIFGGCQYYDWKINSENRTWTGNG